MNFQDPTPTEGAIAHTWQDRTDSQDRHADPDLRLARLLEGFRVVTVDDAASQTPTAVTIGILTAAARGRLAHVEMIGDEAKTQVRFTSEFIEAAEDGRTINRVGYRPQAFPIYEDRPAEVAHIEEVHDDDDLVAGLALPVVGSGQHVFTIATVQFIPVTITKTVRRTVNGERVSSSTQWHAIVHRVLAEEDAPVPLYRAGELLPWTVKDRPPVEAILDEEGRFVRDDKSQVPIAYRNYTVQGWMRCSSTDQVADVLQDMKVAISASQAKRGEWGDSLHTSAAALDAGLAEL